MDTQGKQLTPDNSQVTVKNQTSSQEGIDQQVPDSKSQTKTTSQTDDQQIKDSEKSSDIHTSDTSKSGAKWYVVHSYSGHESKVANTLKQRIESLKLSDKILD